MPCAVRDRGRPTGVLVTAPGGHTPPEQHPSVNSKAVSPQLLGKETSVAIHNNFVSRPDGDAGRLLPRSALFAVAFAVAPQPHPTWGLHRDLSAG